ncbi:hypothetical protein B0H11DRAFT_1193551 [Mycena galericulata]|nr:hypothetical protein B0H11DRAFT_1193551 [Mycena galericulata]
MKNSTLPPELEREIFECAAIYHPNLIPSLLRVARRVQLWVEPYLYRIIVTHPGPPYTIVEDAILRPTPHSKPASFYRDAVRHVYLSHQHDVSPEILQMFTRTRNLAMTATSSPELLPILLEMDLRRLSLSLEDIFDSRQHIDLKHPLFNSITHLDVFDAMGEIDAYIAPHLASLPALTHLCLNNRVPGHILRALLSDCPRLRLLVNLWYYQKASSGRALADDPPVADRRFVVGLYRDYQREWTAGARGEPDFWTMAEDFVARKRGGAIPESLYWMEPVA